MYFITSPRLVLNSENLPPCSLPTAVCTHLDTLLGCVSSRGWGSQCSRAISTSTSTPSLSFNPWLPHSLPATRSITTRPGGVPITTRHGKGLAAGHERHLTPLLQHHEPAVSAQLVLPQESAAAAAAAEAEAEAETYEAEAEGSNIEMVADMGGAHPAAHLQRASLQEGLAEAGLSFPAIMAVLRILGKISRVNITLDRALSSFAALQNYFGPDRANSLVLALPSILARRPEPLLQNFECLVEVLGGGRAFALAMITAAPDLIIRRPSVIAERMELLCKLFEVGGQVCVGKGVRSASQQGMLQYRVTATLRLLRQSAQGEHIILLHCLLWPCLEIVNADKCMIAVRYVLHHSTQTVQAAGVHVSPPVGGCIMAHVSPQECKTRGAIIYDLCRPQEAFSLATCTPV